MTFSLVSFSGFILAYSADQGGLRANRRFSRGDNLFTNGNTHGWRCAQLFNDLAPHGEVVVMPFGDLLIFGKDRV